jgi:hypothetical protein
MEIAMQHKMVELLDITAPEGPVEVEIQHRPNGMVLYVHIDGMSVLRVCQIKYEQFLVIGPDGKEVVV